MRIRSLVPYLFVVFTLCLLGWAGYQHIDRPTLGLYWDYSSGLVYQVDNGNPSISSVKIGDRLLSGNGLEPKGVYSLIDHGEIETVLLQLERAGSVYTIQAELIHPDFFTVLSRISFILIAFSFWLTGTFIYTFSQDRKLAILFLFFCIFTSITLAAGSVSSFGPDWSKVLLYLGVIWCGFFAVHLHLDFPSRVNLPHRTVLLILLASLSGFLTLLFCGRNLDFMPEGSQRILWLVGLIVFSFEMLAVIGSVCKSYLRASSADERYRAGIIVLATILGIIPVLLFSVLPDVLMGRTLIPHEFSFLGLLAFPLGYGFAILRLKLVHLDSTMDRGAALTFVILIITGFYTLAFSFLSRFFPGVYDQYSLAGLVITILIAVSSRRLYGSLLIWINRVLYGEWYDYRSAIHMINDHLKSVETEFQSITTTFCQVVMKSLQLDFVAMISHDRWYTLVETGNEPCSVHVPDQYFESIWSVITASDTSKSLESHSNQSILAPILSDRLMPRIQLVMPIQSQEEIFGLLILGRKRGGGVFESSDMDVLDVAIHQAQISLEKARLLVDVREYSNDIRELHRKVTQTREEERKQVARELHDQVIQSLVSLNYRLSEMRRRSVHTKDEDIQTVQNDVVSVIGNVRQICTNLRPPVLDSLDLASAFRSKIDEHLGQTAFNIHFFVHGDNEKDIPEPVRSYAYRFLQESLTNVSKHARAQNVEVHLSIKADEIIIIVQDDGKGFPGPTHLGLFEKAQHFGLISLLEDARSLNGTLEIDSSIGEGCCLVATIPLASECYSK